MENINLNRFLDKFGGVIAGRSLAKLVVSNPRDRSSDLRSITYSLAEIRGETRVKCVYRHATKDITKHYPPDEAVSLAKEFLEQDFLNADLFATGETVRLFVSASGKYKLRAGEPLPGVRPGLQHDHAKERWVPTEGNTWLHDLGVLNHSFAVRAEMRDKYLQINRYIELLEPVFRGLPGKGPLEVADMGSGKGYLTFALYHHLVSAMNRPVRMTGVEARADLADFCNTVAGNAGFGGLSFRQGTISDAGDVKAAVLIALHACDTATDDAIAHGIRTGAKVIVCAPCCQKQVRKDLKPEGALHALLKHGILEERQAELLTDSIRALLLEANGYKTQVFEFISTEHTPKNLMIVARKGATSEASRRKALEAVAEIKALFGLGRHYLEERLDNWSVGQVPAGQASAGQASAGQ